MEHGDHRDNVMGNVVLNCGLFGGGSSNIGVLSENAGKRC